MKHFLFLFLCSLSVNVVYAQHYNSWLRTTLSWTIDKHWSTDAELQIRRQNNLGSNDPFDKRLLYSYRHWVYFKYNENLRFALSPFAYYQSYNPIITEQDADHAPSKEYRFTVAAEMKQRLVKRFYLSEREALEYRLFVNVSDLLRLRSKVSMGYIFTTHWSLYASYETLINVAGISRQHFFDQDRLGGGIQFVHDRWKVETGYLHVNRLLRNADDVFEEHDFFLHLTYRIPHRKSLEV